MATAGGTPAGAGDNLKRLTSNDRAHDHAPAKGADAATMYLELYGRGDGYKAAMT